MNLRNKLGYIFYVIALILIILGILSFPVVTDTLTPSLGHDSFLIITTSAIRSYLSWYLGFFVICLLAYTFDRVVGFGEWTLHDIRRSWRYMPNYMIWLVRIITPLLFLINLEAFILFIWDVSGLSSIALESYTQWSLQYFHWGILAAPLHLFNFTYITILLSLTILAHLKQPTWRRIKTTPNFDPTKTIGKRTMQLPEKDRKRLRKAERWMEKGKYFKAAKAFESMGSDFYYRAARLYSDNGYEKEASAAYKKAGDYFSKQKNYNRAGDAYFFGGHWDAASHSYVHCHPTKTFAGDPDRINLWSERWGESLYHLGNFAEAAGKFQSAGLHKKAGEAFEKAGLHSEAAEAYREAGAYEDSAKALEEGGYKELAQLEKAKMLYQREQYVEAAAAFEELKDYERASDAYLKADLPTKAALCRTRLGHFERAAELYLGAGEERRALECYERMEDWQKAAHLAAHLGIQDKQAWYYQMAGKLVLATRAYLMTGQVAEAVSCMQKIDVEDSREVEGALQILKILFDQNRSRDALACTYGLLDGKPTPTHLAPVIFYLGNLHRKMGNMEKALHFYKKASKLEPKEKAYKKAVYDVSDLMGESEPRTQQAHLKTTALNTQPIDDVTAQAAIRRQAEEVKEADETTLTLDEHSVFDLTTNGKNLRRYQVIKEVGRGGMGFVYKAKDKKLKRFIALKMLHPEHNHDPRVVLFFKREARAIAQLNHPNIVQLFDLGKESGCFYMVMEYVEGHTLKRLYERYPDFMERNLVPIWHQACVGLRHAHAQGILHRDLKPSNLMWTRDRRLKILDFGLAKEITDLNQTAQIWGTPSFMAPELFQGQRATFQTDIYGIGAAFYMLACGSAPFSGDDTTDKFTGDGLPKPPRDIRPSLSQDLSDTIMGCMYLEPSKRFKTMQELMTRLKAISKKKK